MAHVHTFADLDLVQRVTDNPADCDQCHGTDFRRPQISDPRVAAHVDLVAYGETPDNAERMIAETENTHRTVCGEYGVVAYDDEPPFRGVGGSPYYVSPVVPAYNTPTLEDRTYGASSVPAYRPGDRYAAVHRPQDRPRPLDLDTRPLRRPRIPPGPLLQRRPRHLRRLEAQVPVRIHRHVHQQAQGRLMPPAATASPAERISVGLVACAATKAATPQPARLLYRSQLFRAASAYAARTYDHWFVLSARHYLVHPDEHLAPYDQTLARMPIRDREHWASMIESGIRLGYGCMTEGRLDWPPRHPRLQLGAWMQAGRDAGIDRRVDLWFHAGAAYTATRSSPGSGGCPTFRTTSTHRSPASASAASSPGTPNAGSCAVLPVNHHATGGHHGRHHDTDPARLLGAGPPVPRHRRHRRVRPRRPGPRSSPSTDSARAWSFLLVHAARDYDSKAILGVAYGHATGTPLGPRQFSGGTAGAAGVLRRLGFTVRQTM